MNHEDVTRDQITPGISMWFQGPRVVDYGLAGPLIDANAMEGKGEYRDPLVPSCDVIGSVFQRGMAQILAGTGWRLTSVISRGRAELELVLLDPKEVIWRVPVSTNPWTATALLERDLLREAAERVRDRIYGLVR